MPLSSVFKDPQRLQQLSQFLTNFGTGVATADARGLSPFASLALGFGAGGQGIQQAKQIQQGESDRALQRELAQERLQSSQQRRKLTGRRAQAETALADEVRSENPLAASVAESGNVGAAANLITQPALAEAGRQFQAQQSQLNRQFQSEQANLGRQFTAGQGELNRGFRAQQSELGRQFQAEQGAVGREFQAEQGVLGREFQATQAEQNRVLRTALAKPNRQITRVPQPDGTVKTQVINLDTGQVEVELGQGTVVTFQPQTVPGAVEKKERIKAKESLRDTIGAITQASAQLARLNELGGGVSGIRAILSENVGGALGQLPIVGEGAEEAFTQLISGASPEEVQNFMTNSRALVAQLIAPFTGEESGRITENERALSAQASRLAEPGASPSQMRAALQTVVQLQAVMKDRFAIQSGAPTTFDLETDDGIDAMGERLVEFGLTEDLAIQTLRIMRQQRRELKESGIKF